MDVLPGFNAINKNRENLLHFANCKCKLDTRTVKIS